jgi:HlyD family secretion protein
MTKRWGIGVIGALMGAVVLGALWLAWRPAPLVGVLEASGRIEGDQAAVGPKIAGKVARISVREGDRLEAGALIAELASDQVQAQLDRAEHGLHTVREQLGEAQARVDSVQRQLEAAEIAVTLAERESRARIGEAEAALGTTRARLGSAQRQAEAAVIAVSLAEQESRARIGEAEAALGAAQAQVRQAEADLDKAAKDHARSRELFARELIAAQQLDQARTAEAVARATVEAARKQVGRSEEILEGARASRVAVELRRKDVETAAEAVEAARKQAVQAEETLRLAQASQVAVELRRKEAQTAAERVREARATVGTLRAQIQSADAEVTLARANLADTRVLAPFAGTVLKKLVESGEVVAAGTPLVTLLDLSKLHAKVYVAERDLGTVKVGDPGRVYTDAFPRRYFDATVVEVAQQAEFTPRDVHMKDERVKQVFAVKLAIRNPEGVLKPGMPVDTRIRWSPGAPWGDGLP